METTFFIKTLMFLLIGSFLSIPCHSGDFEITKVIEIGPADEGFMSWPLRWSPDGKWLAYFHSGNLMLSDTLGNSHQVKKIDFFPRRFEWLSNEEIVGYFDEGYDIDSSKQLLMQVDVTTGVDTIIEEYIRYGRRGNTNWFQGPWRTAKGNVYYDYGERFGPLKIDRSEERRWANSRRGKKLTEIAKRSDYVLHWGQDGIYKVLLSGDDSIRIAPHPAGEGPGGITMSPDGSYINIWGTLLRLSDSATIYLDNLVDDKPVGTKFCGCLSVSFNPLFPEALFRQSCDSDGHEILVDRIGVFNLQELTYSFLQPNPQSKHCISPTYSPDGLKIAVLCDSKCYIIFREIDGRLK
jgi:hypothetical protein